MVIVILLWFLLFLLPVIIQIKFLHKFINTSSKKYWYLLCISEIVSLILYSLLFLYATTLSGWGPLGYAIPTILGIYITITILLLSIIIKIRKYVKLEALKGQKYNSFALIFAFLLIFIVLFEIFSDMYVNGFNFPKGKTLVTVENVSKNDVTVSFIIDDVKYESVYDTMYKKYNLYSMESKYKKGQQFNAWYYSSHEDSKIFYSSYTNQKYYVRKADTSEFICIPLLIVALLIIGYQFRRKLFFKK